MKYQIYTVIPTIASQVSRIVIYGVLEPDQLKILQPRLLQHKLQSRRCHLVTGVVAAALKLENLTRSEGLHISRPIGCQ